MNILKIADELSERLIKIFERDQATFVGFSYMFKIGFRKAPSEAIASRLEAIASMLEAMAIRLEAIEDSRC